MLLKNIRRYNMYVDYNEMETFITIHLANFMNEVSFFTLYRECKWNAPNVANA